MALTIIKEPGMAARQIVVQERIVVTIDGSRLVGPGESGRLLATPGQPITEQAAAQLGIGPDGRRIAPMAAPAPETKVIMPGAPARRGRRK